MTAQRKKTRVRSPAYPVVDLEAAISQAKEVYKHEKRALAPVAVVVKHCGLDIKNSSGVRLIAAFKQFGLAVEKGSKEDRQLRLSEAALDILLAPSDDATERIAAIKAAATAPKVHKIIWDHYGGELPSDASLRSFLIRSLEFNDAHVDRFIRQFRKTIEFANLAESDIIDPENGVENNYIGDSEMDTLASETSHAAGAVTITAASTGGVRDFPVPLISGGIAVLRVPFPMSEDDFAQLESTLHAWKKALVKTKTLSPKPSGASDEENSQ